MIDYEEQTTFRDRGSFFSYWISTFIWLSKKYKVGFNIEINRKRRLIYDYRDRYETFKALCRTGG